MLLSSVGFEPVEAAREAQLMSSSVLPPKMTLPYGWSWVMVSCRFQSMGREREESWASSFLPFLLSDMGVTHPVLGENLVWWLCPAQRDSGKCNL